MAGIMEPDGDGNVGTMADYYCSNLHKWCFAPVAVAFLWVSPYAPSRAQLHHPIISHRFNEKCISSSSSLSTLGDDEPVTTSNYFESGDDINNIEIKDIVHDLPIFAECSMTGTNDYSASLVIPECFKFIEYLGGLQVIRQRNKTLCTEVVELLSTAWGTTEYVQHESLRTCSMCMIGCPNILGSTAKDADTVRMKLREEYNIVIQKFFPVQNDRLYLRLSVAVYNYLNEFNCLKDAILDIVSKS